MSLPIGTRVGPYEVTAPIGAGGMGEVFRARDPRLDRDVALKILPAGFSLDPERLARFEREAKTLAALNHPNIAAIHGLEDARLDDGTVSRALMAVSLSPGPSGSARAAVPTRLFQIDPRLFRSFDVAADGQRFLVNIANPDAVVRTDEVVVDWTRRLRR